MSNSLEHDALTEIEQAILREAEPKRVLLSAIEAVRAGSELNASEARVVLSVTRSKDSRLYNGEFHYSDSYKNDPYIMGGAVIPEVVHLAAVKIQRAAPAKPTRKPKAPTHDYGLFEELAERRAKYLMHNNRGLANPLHYLACETLTAYNRDRDEQGLKRMPSLTKPAREIIANIKRKFEK